MRAHLGDWEPAAARLQGNASSAQGPDYRTVKFPSVSRRALRRGLTILVDAGFFHGMKRP